MKNLYLKIIGGWINSLSLISPSTAGKKGFELFCTVAAPPVKHYHKEFFDISVKGSFDYEGERIQIYAWGSGPKKIILMHGWRSHSFRWKNYIAAIDKQQYTVYAFDAPAHGLSDGKYLNLYKYSKVIQKFIESHGPFDAVITHSMGGFSLLHALYTNPGIKIGRLVLTGTPGEATDFMDFCCQLFGLNARSMKIIEAYFEKIVGDPPSWYSTGKFATAVKAPTLVVHDQDDLEALYKYGVAIHHAISNSSLITTKGLGHNLKSQALIKEILDFVDGKSVSTDTLITESELRNSEQPKSETVNR